jgi:hypothetical protein
MLCNKLAHIVNDLANQCESRVSGGRLLECSLVYFFLSLINLRAKLVVTPAWFDGTLASNHQKLLSFDYMNNEQSRLAQFVVPEVIVRLTGCEVETAYILQRWVFVLCAFVCFHLYQRKWFDEAMCFTGVVCLAAVLPLTYVGDLQESSPLLMVVFLLILWSIREGGVVQYAVLLLLGALVNETVLILPAVFFFYRWPGWSLVPMLRLAMLTLSTALPAYVYTLAIRYATWDRPHLGGDRIQFGWNLSGIARDAGSLPIDFWRARFLFFLFVFGAFWLFAFVDYWKKPLFLRRAALAIPLFILAHLITGKINESRQMIPLAYIVLPMGLMSLFPTAVVSREKPDEWAREDVR